MRHYIATMLLALFLSGCAPGATVAGSGDWETSGECSFDEAGYEISYDESKDRTTFVFWVAGGECDFEE